MPNSFSVLSRATFATSWIYLIVVFKTTYKISDTKMPGDADNFTICSANQLTGFYVRGALTVKGLTGNLHFRAVLILATLNSYGNENR